MKDFILRLSNEYHDLCSRTYRLQRFTESRKIKNLELEEQKRLLIQLDIMGELKDILKERLEYYNVRV